MVDKSEMIVKSVGKITFMEMTMPVVFKLTQTRNLAGCIPKQGSTKKRTKLDSVKCLLKEKYLPLDHSF